MANSPRYLFVKAQIKGGALGDLFEARVPVASHTTKHGTFVPEHQTTVHKRHDDPKPAASDDTKMLEGLPDGSRFVEGRGPLGRGQWGVEHEGRLIWNIHPSKEVAAKEARDAVARRKTAEDDKAQSAARDADIAKRIHAGEDPTDSDLKHLGLNTGGKHSRFDYLSPAVQRVFGVSKPKVREAMGDSLVEASNDGGTKTHWGKPAKVLKNAAAWSRAAKPAAPDPAARKHFYVSAIDGARKHLVAGPYASHDEAVGMVEHVRAHADKHDPRAHFMAWGTAGSDSPIKTPLGEGWKPPPAAEASSSTPAKPAKLKPAKPRGETVLGEPRAMHGDLILVPEESSTGAVGGGTKKTWRFGKVTGVNRAGYAMRHETPGIKVGGPMKKHEGHVHQSFIVQQEHMNGMSADDVLAKLPREYPGQHDWLKDYAHPDHAKADLLAAIGRHPLDAAA